MLVVVVVAAAQTPIVRVPRSKMESAQNSACRAGQHVMHNLCTALPPTHLYSTSRHRSSSSIYQDQRSEVCRQYESMIGLRTISRVSTSG